MFLGLIRVATPLSDDSPSPGPCPLQSIRRRDPVPSGSRDAPMRRRAAQRVAQDARRVRPRGRREPVGSDARRGPRDRRMDSLDVASRCAPEVASGRRCLGGRRTSGRTRLRRSVDHEDPHSFSGVLLHPLLGHKRLGAQLPHSPPSTATAGSQVLNLKSGASSSAGRRECRPRVRQWAVATTQSVDPVVKARRRRPRSRLVVASSERLGRLRTSI